MGTSNELASRILSRLASVWPDPTRARKERFGVEDATSEAYHQAYAVDQFMKQVSLGAYRPGVLRPFWGAEVLEIGCGRGGITCYLGSLGPKRAVGIDINTSALEQARALQRHIEEKSGATLPVEFREMDCMSMTFEDASFDMVYAANIFEHITDPRRLLLEVARVLRKDGKLVVPVFSSILSKWGLHLKNGLRVPWANLFFSEATIVRALQRQAESRPELYEIYPGLQSSPRRVRDVRKHGDLNDITHAAFKALAAETGFVVEQFYVHATPLGRVAFKLAPMLQETRAADVLSTGAAALLIKA